MNKTIHFNGQPVEAYPLAWPMGFERTPANKRKSVNFSRRGAPNEYGNRPSRRMTVAEAIKRLNEQVRSFSRTGHVWRIDPDRVVVSTNMPTRNDGMPFSGAREPDDPGAVVYFHLDRVPYCMPCDHWDQVADNITAIAKHLEAIRGIERWGVGSLRRQFTGFKALPPSSGSPAPAESAMTVEQAACCIIALAADSAEELTPMDVLKSPESCHAAYKRAAMQTHPDRGGNQADFVRLQQAVDLLKRHHAGVL